MILHRHTNKEKQFLGIVRKSQSDRDTGRPRDHSKPLSLLPTVGETGKAGKRGDEFQQAARVRVMPGPLVEVRGQHYTWWHSTG